jgi:site-specific recombinase XerD
LQHITVDAVRIGQAVTTNKGKSRTIFLPTKLIIALSRYTKQRDISSGPVFITKTGKPIDRRDVWAGMKKLCAVAKVEPSKVFPHNLRALFACEFYGKHKDVVRLADMLGHSNMETTRLYTMESGAVHRRMVESLGLVVGLRQNDASVWPTLEKTAFFKTNHTTNPPKNQPNIHL